MAQKIIDLMLQKNNDNKNLIEDKIAFLTKDPNHKYKNENPFYKIADLLNKDENKEKVDDYYISYHQNDFLNKLKNPDINFFIAQAGTGFGKTWLTSNSRKENQIYIHIVPNDILVSQGIWQLKENASNEFNFSEKKYIFCTPEKLFGNLSYIVSNFYLIDKIIFDECHIIFDNSDARSSFYKFVLKLLLKYKRENQQFVFLSPFLKKIDVDEFKNIIKNKIQYDIYDGFTSEFLTKNFDNEIIEGFDVNKVQQVNQKQSGINLFYFSSIQRAREEFSKRISSLNNNIADFITKIFNYASLFEEWKKIDVNLIENYDVIRGISNGVALYHSSIPDEIKNFIFLSSKAGFITDIYATSALLNGTDLQIKNITIDSVKNGIEKNKVFSMNQFLNLAGRSGRYQPGKERIFGLISFKRNNENAKWIKMNKNNIFLRRKGGNYRDNDEELMWFVNKSEEIALKKNDKQIEEIVFLDPRINPKTTIKLSQDLYLINDFKERVLKLIELDYSFNNELIWEDQNKALELIKPIFKFYKDSFPKGGFRFDEIDKFNYDKISSIRLFIKYMNVFNERDIIKGFAWYNFQKEYQGEKSNIRFEKMVSLIKNKVKFEIMLIFNHIFLLNNYFTDSKYNLYDIVTFKTKDIFLINYINKYQKNSDYFDFVEKTKKINSKYFLKAINLKNFKKYLEEIKK